MATTHGGTNYIFLFGDQISKRSWRLDVNLIRHILESPLRRILAEYFWRKCGTTDMGVPLMNFLCRRYEPMNDTSDERSIPFHQDGKLLPECYRMINCWTLLAPDECGNTSPGLEFGTGVDRLIDFEERGTSPLHAWLETNHAFVEELMASGRIFKPSISLGDVMMFDEIALHRTRITSLQKLPRYSAEVRFIGLSREVRDYRDKHDPHPYFDISGDAITGPAVVEQIDNGSLRERERGVWALTN